MHYHNDFTPTYIFSLHIERSGHVLVDTAVTVKANAEEIAKAKETIQRLMDEYALAIEPTQASAPNPEAAPTPPLGEKPNGVRGLLRLRCPECGDSFGIFLRERQTEVICKCGHHIDLTIPLARYRFNCPYCGKETWGQTNLEDPEITTRCKCGGDVKLRWAPKAKEYQAITKGEQEYE